MRAPSLKESFSTFRIKLFVLLISACVRCAYADIAPTTFVGSNAYPLESSEVRLNEAEVHIAWGNPCSLRADFTLQNEKDESLDLEIGFPVGAYRQTKNGELFDDEEDDKAPPVMEETDPGMITIVVNGDSVAARRKTPHERVNELKWGYASWYFAKITLRPGTNIVTVRTKLSPSGVYGEGYKRRLSYCIWTGGRWKGPIGHESVEINFPTDVDPSSLSRVHPESGKITERSIRWDFTQIEPQSDEYDIALEFLHPRVAAKLAEVKSEYLKNPMEPKAALRYATHLFWLGAAKGNSGFPPEVLTHEEFNTCLAGIENKNDRAAFKQFYSIRTKLGFASKSTEWTEARVQILRILADSGYSQHYPEYQRVQEARRIVEGCLAQDPSNADAWFVYLNQFWRFSFAARGHWFGSTVYSIPQQRAISAAYKHCSTDVRIRAWKEAMVRNSAAPTTVPAFSSDVNEAWKNEYHISEDEK